MAPRPAGRYTARRCAASQVGWSPGLDAYLRAFGLRVLETPIPTAGRLDYEDGRYVIRVQRAPDGRVEYHFVIVDYLCTVRAGVVAHGSDASDVRWVSVSELAAHRVSDKAIEVILKAVGLQAR